MMAHDIERVLERALRAESRPVLRPQHKTVVQGLLMKLVSERRADFRPWFIRKVEAKLTDDAESIMLEVIYGDEPEDIIAIFFGRDDETFDAAYVESAFVGPIELMN